MRKVGVLLSLLLLITFGAAGAGKGESAKSCLTRGLAYNAKKKACKKPSKSFCADNGMELKGGKCVEGAPPEPAEDDDLPDD